MKHMARLPCVLAVENNLILTLGTNLVLPSGNNQTTS